MDEGVFSGAEISVIDNVLRSRATATTELTPANRFEFLRPDGNYDILLRVLNDEGYQEYPLAEELTITGDTDLSYEQRFVTLTLQVLLNGGALPDSDTGYERGELIIRPITGNWLTVLSQNLGVTGVVNRPFTLLHGLDYGVYLSVNYPSSVFAFQQWKYLGLFQRRRTVRQGGRFSLLPWVLAGVQGVFILVVRGGPFRGAASTSLFSQPTPAMDRMMKKRKVCFVSLGCPKNLVDTEGMLGLTEKQGHSLVSDPDDADVLVVNTCAFIDSAKQESIETILDMARRKEEGKAQLLVVTGCLAQRYGEELAKELPEVDHFLGTTDFPRLTEILSGKESPRVQVGKPAPVDWTTIPPPAGHSPLDGLFENQRGVQLRVFFLHHSSIARPPAKSPRRRRCWTKHDAFLPRA